MIYNTIIAENYLGNDTSAGDDIRGFIGQAFNGNYVTSNVRGGNNLIGVCPDAGLLEFLLGVGSDFTNGNGNQIGTVVSPIDPQLGPLADNGGPTFTHALSAGSPAIDRGLNAKIPTDALDLDHDDDISEAVSSDQRVSPSLGTNITDVSVAQRLKPFLRIVNNNVDVGAFEFHAAPVADPGEDYTVNEGDNLALSGEGSSDPNGTILWYELDLDYDGVTLDVDDSGEFPLFSRRLPMGPLRGRSLCA